MGAAIGRAPISPTLDFPRLPRMESTDWCVDHPALGVWAPPPRGADRPEDCRKKLRQQGEPDEPPLLNMPIRDPINRPELTQDNGHMYPSVMGAHAPITCGCGGAAQRYAMQAPQTMPEQTSQTEEATSITSVGRCMSRASRPVFACCSLGGGQSKGLTGRVKGFALSLGTPRTTPPTPRAAARKPD